jgi:tetratricopeptide (TPR) repeat protein
MVHVARHDLATAEDVLRQGLAARQRGAGGRHRFPGSGLHWLLGLVRLAAGAIDEAEAEFDRELTARGSEMYAAEYAMDAYDGHGFARLAAGDAAGASIMFGKALEIAPNHARSLVGTIVAHERLGQTERARRARQQAAFAIRELRESGRAAEAAISTALLHVVSARWDEAVAGLRRLLHDAPPGFAGWTIPVEPLLAPIRHRPSYRDLIDRLAARVDAAGR